MMSLTKMIFRAIFKNFNKKIMSFFSLCNLKNRYEIFWNKFNEIYEKIDSDQDGEISFDELIDYLADRADELGLIRTVFYI